MWGSLSQKVKLGASSGLCLFDVEIAEPLVDLAHQPSVVVGVLQGQAHREDVDNY